MNCLNSFHTLFPVFFQDKEKPQFHTWREIWLNLLRITLVWDSYENASLRITGTKLWENWSQCFISRQCVFADVYFAILIFFQSISITILVKCVFSKIKWHLCLCLLSLYWPLLYDYALWDLIKAGVLTVDKLNEGDILTHQTGPFRLLLGGRGGLKWWHRKQWMDLISWPICPVSLHTIGVFVWVRRFD